MSRLPFLFIITGMIGFLLFHVTSLFSLSSWLTEGLRGPNGWFHAHLFVLGWATMLAMGAVYQLINVILQTNVYNVTLGYIHYIVFTVGLIGLLFGFYNGAVQWIALFAFLTFIGVLLFVWNMTMTLFRASRWDAITISAACSILYLLLTGVTGLLMGLNFAFGSWNELHQHLFGTHIWLGTVGWFGLLITGFSYKMLPMFYLAHDYPIRLQRIILLLWNAGVIVGALSLLFNRTSWLLLLALLLIVAAIIVYNAHILQIKKHRHKRSPGSGIQWSMYGNHAFMCFAILILLNSVLFMNEFVNTKSVILVGWIYLGGWVSFTILSYASKIVPFLWWTHKFGKLVGKPGTPVMSDLLNEKYAYIGLAAIAIASLLLATGLALDTNSIIAIGGIVYSAFSIAYISLIGLVFTK